MSLLKNLTSDASIADEKDSLGSGGVFDSGVYKFTVSLAYLIQAASEALGLVLHLKADNGRELRQTVWMTSGKDKGKKNYYEDKQGEKHYLPGYIIANGLALLTVGKEISEIDTEQKVVNLYSKEAKAEVPTKVDMLTELLGKEIQAGVIKQVVDKTQKTDAGYVPTGETREENEIDKLFRARDGMTTTEIRAKADAAAFIATWEAKWAGQVKNKATKAAGTAGAPKAAGAGAATTAKPAKSLFA